MKLEDIARIAGVSKSAVSFAFNGKPGIGPDTRERILKIAKEHGYIPKPRTPSQEQSAKSLTFLVIANSGIVLEQYYQQPFFRELIHYIEERSRSQGYSLLFASIDMETLDRGIQSIAEEKNTDGFILLGTNLDETQIAGIADKLNSRLVVLDTCFETLPVQFVEINNTMGAYQAGRYLCELGHRTIGYIASNVRIHNFEDRDKGFTAALRDFGLEVAEKHVFSVAPTILSSQEGLKEQFLRYLATGQTLPTALFCECDYIAISAMKTLSELGYLIPEDISVVGFDNITEAVIVTPELTTVHVEKESMAQLAVDLMIRTIESDQPVTTKIKVDTKFVERLSAHPPKSADPV